MLSRFQGEARSLGVDLGPEQIEKFRVYLEVLREWNRVVRLVGQDDEETIVWVHFMDSLSAYQLVKEGESLLDIGSGAGFPGVPLKIARPSIHLSLVESRARKASFLKQLVRELNLENVAVHACRVEQPTFSGRFTAVISRGLGPPGKWLPWASGMLDEGGRIILMLGPAPEMGEVEKQVEKAGLRLLETWGLTLPVVRRKRRLAVVGKG